MTTKSKQNNHTARSRSMNKSSGSSSIVTYNVNDSYTDRCKIIRQPDQIYTCVRTIETSTPITGSNTVPVFGAYTFSFGQIPDVASLQGVFDQYRIDKVEYQFFPVANISTSAAPVTGQFTTAIDYDDAIAPTTIGQVTDYANAITSLATQKQRRCWVPHIAVATYSGAFTSYGNFRPTWIDCTSYSVNHYGIKYALDVQPSNAVAYNVYIRAQVSLRASR
jgi:hypothetical protein